MVVDPEPGGGVVGGGNGGRPWEEALLVVRGAAVDATSIGAGSVGGGRGASNGLCELAGPIIAGGAGRGMLEEETAVWGVRESSIGGE